MSEPLERRTYVSLSGFKPVFEFSLQTETAERERERESCAPFLTYLTVFDIGLAFAKRQEDCHTSRTLKYLSLGSREQSQKRRKTESFFLPVVAVITGDSQELPEKVLLVPLVCTSTAPCLLQACLKTVSSASVRVKETSRRFSTLSNLNSW